MGDSVEEWRAGSVRAWEKQEVVAGQLAELIFDLGMPGSSDAFARRLRDLAAAKASGDRALLRAALMDTATAAAAWVVAIDLDGPVLQRR